MHTTGGPFVDYEKPIFEEMGGRKMLARKMGGDK